MILGASFCIIKSESSGGSNVIMLNLEIRSNSQLWNVEMNVLPQIRSR